VPKSHAERSPGFRHGDVGPQNSRSVLALERDEMSARIEHRDRQRRTIRFTPFFQRDLDDGAGLREDDHGGSVFGQSLYEHGAISRVVPPANALALGSGRRTRVLAFAG